MRSRKKNRIILLLTLLLMITVGFALLSTTLKIKGISLVRGNIWDIHWDRRSIRVNVENIATATGITGVTTVTTKRDTVLFEVNLELPGDFYEFKIDAVNEGTIDGVITNVSKLIYDKDDYDTNGDNATPLDTSYLTFTVVYDDNGEEPANDDLLEKRVDTETPTRRTYKVRVEYDENATTIPENDVTYMCVLKITYGQGTSASGTTNSDGLRKGSVVRLGNSEDFYVIKSDSEKTVLLAKYNLMVGYSDELSGNGLMTSDNTQGYGLQSEDAIGYDSYNHECIATVPFSESVYWMDESTYPRILKGPYNENNTIYWDSDEYEYKYVSTGEFAYPTVYDPTYNTGPDFNSASCYYTCWQREGYTISYYVEEYVNRLKTMGAPSTITGRLLTIEEEDKAEDIEVDGTSIILDGHQDYWLGSISSYSDIFYVDSRNQYHLYSQSCNSPYAGVRPVIEIPTSELQ